MEKMCHTDANQRQADVADKIYYFRLKGKFMKIRALI